MALIKDGVSGEHTVLFYGKTYLPPFYEYFITVGNNLSFEKPKQYIIGWVNYFRLADIKSLLPRVDEWYRRRLRAIIWKQWKRIRTRLGNLIKLGIAKYKAWEYANTRKSYWRTANSPILKRTVTNNRLKQTGYIFFTDRYRKVNGIN